MTDYEPLSKPVCVYILDDHRFIAELLASRLSVDHNIEVVGMGNKASTGLHFVGREQVDVLLVDMDLGDDNGLDVTRDMLAMKPQLRIIGLSAHAESHYPIALLEAGGRGFISKRASATDILDAVRRVARGDLAISPDVAMYLATALRDSGPARKLRALTAKEIDVLRLISVGCSVTEISTRLDISTKTVQSHRANMKKKLSLTTDVELCLLALKAGVVQVHDEK